MIDSRFVLNGEIKINYLINNTVSEKTPLVYVPGMFGSAEEFLFESFETRKNISISLRGRGQSDAPVSGYSFEDHVKDIEQVLSEARVENICLMAFSRELPTL
ncbi:MAG: hypothetical protein WD469_10380 [Paenibacillaceae bacterium]